jgi:hypothetical protein
MRLKKAYWILYLPMQSLEASENWNNCVIWNLENELKWSKRHMLRNRNRHAGRFRKSEKKCNAFFVIEIAFGFTLVEKKFKKSTMKNRNSKACVCN